MDAFWTIVVAMLANMNCALIGTYLVLKKVAMVGDAIAHATLPGIVCAILLTGSKHSPILLVGAGITGLLVTFLITWLEKKITIQTDAAIGINFTFLFAVGVILISFFSRKIDLDPECSLYGDLATVPLNTYRTASGFSLGPKAFYTLLIMLITNVIFLVVGYKYLFVTTFDPAFAKSIGISTTVWHYALMAITSLITVTAFEIAGAILVVALLIVPAACMCLITRLLKNLLWYNVLFSIGTSIMGYYISLWFNSSMAATMVTLTGLFFLIIFILVQYRRNYAS